MSNPEYPSFILQRKYILAKDTVSVDGKSEAGVMIVVGGIRFEFRPWDPVSMPLPEANYLERKLISLRGAYPIELYDPQKHATKMHRFAARGPGKDLAAEDLLAMSKEELETLCVKVYEGRGGEENYKDYTVEELRTLVAVRLKMSMKPLRRAAAGLAPSRAATKEPPKEPVPPPAPARPAKAKFSASDLDAMPLPDLKAKLAECGVDTDGKTGTQILDLGLEHLLAD